MANRPVQPAGSRAALGEATGGKCPGDMPVTASSQTLAAPGAEGEDAVVDFRPATATRLARSRALAESRRAERLFNANEPREGMARLAISLRRQPADPLAATRLAAALLQREWARPLFELGPHAGQVLQTAWSPDGAVILTAGADGQLRAWDAAGGAALPGSWIHGPAACLWLAWSAAGASAGFTAATVARGAVREEVFYNVPGHRLGDLYASPNWPAAPRRFSGEGRGFSLPHARRPTAWAAIGQPSRLHCSSLGSTTTSSSRSTGQPKRRRSSARAAWRMLRIFCAPTPMSIRW